MKFSTELEYWVIDEQGRLTEPEGLVTVSDGVEKEFVKPLLEVKTPPCESIPELRDELFSRLNRVVRKADRQGKGLVPLATPAHQGQIADNRSDRTEIQNRVVGDSFDYVRRCAGTHVHVDQLPGCAIDQLNTLIALDPALALVNSSPYHRSAKLTTGARSKLYRWLAYRHLPYQGQLWRYVEDRQEWAGRLERRYHEFVTEAVIAGFDRQRVESCFDPENAIWTPVRLREEFSTVEWRSPDCALPSEIIRLVGQLVDVLEQVREKEVRISGEHGRITDDEIILPEFAAVEAYTDTAIRDGLSSPNVWSYLDRMGFDVGAFDPRSSKVGNCGELTPAQSRELRLESAERLREDITQTISVGR